MKEQTLVHKPLPQNPDICEAQQLKDEQDKRASIDINAIANAIEMEYAGRARV